MAVRRLRTSMVVLLAVMLGASTASAASGTRGPGAPAAAPVGIQVHRDPIPLPPAAPAAPAVLRDPATVLLADSGDQILVSVGTTFRLDLGTPGDWQVQVSDPAVLGGPSGTALPSSATYTAETPGTARLSAETAPPCLRATPGCLPPQEMFQVTVTVAAGTPAPLTLIRGQVTGISGADVRVGLPAAAPGCPSARVCPARCAPTRWVSVVLVGTTFDGPDGTPVPRPSLAAGDTLTAAGTWAAPGVFDARVAILSRPALPVAAATSSPATASAFQPLCTRSPA